jgi:hypothetical protein
MYEILYGRFYQFSLQILHVYIRDYILKLDLSSRASEILHVLDTCTFFAKLSSFAGFRVFIESLMCGTINVHHFMRKSSPQFIVINIDQRQFANFNINSLWWLVWTYCIVTNFTGRSNTGLDRPLQMIIYCPWAMNFAWSRIYIIFKIRKIYRTNTVWLDDCCCDSVNFNILYFHVNYLILIGWESLDKIYCRPLIDETTPKSVQKHNNGPHCMTTVNILKNIDCANFMRVRFAVDCKTTSFECL